MNKTIFFIFGFVIIYLVYHFTNVKKNPAAAAIMALLPISLISTYAINEKKMQVKYSYHLISVCVITLLCIILLHLLLKYSNLNRYLIITIIILLWILCQHFNY